MLRYENWKTATQGRGCRPDYRERTLAEEIWPSHLIRMHQELGLQDAIEEELDDSVYEMESSWSAREMTTDDIRSVIHAVIWHRPVSRSGNRIN